MQLRRLLENKLPINAYRVYKDNGKIYVEFEGNRGQIMSYLYVGAFAYHMKRIRVATDELEKIENELTTEVIEWGRRNSQREEVRNVIATEDQVREVEEEWDEEEWDGEEEEEEEEEPPRKMPRIRKVFWGVCRTTEYDPETMEPYPRCNDQLKKMLNEKGLVAYLLKNRDEEPNSEDDAYMTPSGGANLFENVHQEHDYENTFNVTEDY
jgi:hypothetical protein